MILVGQGISIKHADTYRILLPTMLGTLLPLLGVFLQNLIDVKRLLLRTQFKPFVTWRGIETKLLLVKFLVISSAVKCNATDMTNSDHPAYNFRRGRSLQFNGLDSSTSVHFRHWGLVFLCAGRYTRVLHNSYLWAPFRALDHLVSCTSHLFIFSLRQPSLRNDHNFSPL